MDQCGAEVYVEECTLYTFIARHNQSYFLSDQNGPPHTLETCRVENLNDCVFVVAKRPSKQGRSPLILLVQMTDAPGHTK